jgi:hypothetical protein
LNKGPETLALSFLGNLSFLRFNRAKGGLMIRILTVVLIVIGSNAVGGKAEAATVNVPLKCDANVEFYADIGDTLNFQWVDPSTGVKWADSQCSDDPVGRDDAVYNQTDSDSTTSYCTPVELTGFLLMPNTKAGSTKCGWMWYRWQNPNNPNNYYANDTFTSDLLGINDGGRQLVEGDVVAELWLNFYASYTSDPRFHYDIIWKGPMANAPAPASDAPSVPVPTLPTILLMVLSGLLGLFGFSRVRASK